MQNETTDYFIKIQNDHHLNIRVKEGGIWRTLVSGPMTWSLTAQTPSQPWLEGTRKSVSSRELGFKAEALADGIRLVYEALGNQEPFSQMKVTIEMKVTKDHEVEFVFMLNNISDWVVREVTAAEFSGIPVAEESELVWPNGLGQRFGELTSLDTQILKYPSGKAAMPWFAICGAKDGIYCGSHDTEMSSREISAFIRENDSVLSFGVKHYPFCSAGAWTSPPLILKPYQGTWHEAAKMYRRWFDQHASLVHGPKWVKQSSGWILGVLKQQHGDVMWDYREGIDHLCDLAEERGLDTLGLFGWAHGGHDYLYPEYIPDPLMGGEQALKDALRRAKARGIRTVLYANGVIMDTSTDYYRYQGNDAMLLRENQEPLVSSIRKFHSASPVTFAKGCTGSEAWRKQMLKLALQAQVLGADGILYDQIGVYAPLECFSTRHRHSSPSTAYTTERSGMIQEIADHMRSINPEFIIMTEGIHDTLLSGIAYVHGWGCGFSPPGAKHHMFSGDVIFPELFRYTFPELPLIQRHSTPMLDRYHANYACVYGLRYEIESRYQADVRYLMEDKVPQLSDYEDCAYYPPNVELMQSMEPLEAKAYLKKIIDFCDRHSEFFREGTFVDTEGMDVTGNGLIAKAYRNRSNRLAVCVWNPGLTNTQCLISVSGQKLVECSEPERLEVEANIPIPPQSVRMYIFDHTTGG